jgi:glycosylphosphatidylinositol phospholipase D
LKAIRFLLFVGCLCIGIFVISTSVLSACGLNTHHEVGIRAVQHFASDEFPEYEQYIRNYPDALIAGTVFPDWGYAFGFPDESEDAHWPPFMDDVVLYLLDNYPKPWAEHEKRLMTFFLGLTCHNMADVQWHSGNGFLGIMGHHDFDGSFQDAHNVGDVGGDVLIVHGMPVNDRPLIWWIPGDDMAAVYQANGNPGVTGAIVKERMFVMFIGSVAEQLAGHLLMPLFANPSPFLTDYLQDYHFGGIDDMAVQTAWDWTYWIGQVESASKNTPPAPMPAYAHNEAAEQAQQALWYEIGLSLIDSGELVITETTVDGGTMLEAQIVPMGILMALPEEKSQPAPLPQENSLRIYAQTSYTDIGISIATGDFNQDGQSDLVLGASGYGTRFLPQRGALHVFHGPQTLVGQTDRPLESQPADQMLVGEDEFGRFGWSLATVDLNADGLDDLAVSAPTTNARGRDYFGRTYVHFGNANTGALSAAPDLNIQMVEYQANLGWALSSGDLDKDGYSDLLVGSPMAQGGGNQRGVVSAYFSSDGFSSGDDLDLSNAGWHGFGENDWDWFGYETQLVDLGVNGEYLLVSAPGVDVGQTKNVGRLYGIALAFINGDDKSTSLNFSVTGAKEFDRTGLSFALLKPYGDDQEYLAIASPSRSDGLMMQGGRVDLISIDALIGDKSLNELPKTASFIGDYPFGRFGWKVRAADLNGDGLDDLLISQPQKDTEKGREAGVVYVWFAGDNFPTGEQDAPMEQAHWVIESPVAPGRFGEQIGFWDADGQGGFDAVISARRDSTGARLAGASTIISAPVVSVDELTPDTGKTGRAYEFVVAGENLTGKGIALILTNGDDALPIMDVRAMSNEQVRFTVTIDPGAELGAYDLTVGNVFGEATVAAAFTLTQGPEGGPVDDDDDDAEAGDDDTAADDDDTVADPDTSKDDDSDDDEGCGC